MESFVESILRRLSVSSSSRDRQHNGRSYISGHSYKCQCGRSVFFRDSTCRACGAPLGYDPLLGEIRALAAGPSEGTWRLSNTEASSHAYRRCGNFDSPARCNWLLPAEDLSPHCISCRLNRTIPDLSDADNRRYWAAIEDAKRRLVSQLLVLGVPVKSKVSEDPERGVAFDLLRSPPDGPRVMTSHGSGLITLNVEEADDAQREKIRHELHEPYRTLVGHFRHEVGHYYWDRLIAGTVWHEPCRALFGDERADYAAALKKNYEKGPPPDWATRYISSYASTHPWEDWAESWAHYLHLLDSLDTALSFGFAAENVRAEVEVEQFTVADLYAPDHPDAEHTVALVNSWVLLTTVLNELAHSMGQPDFYPFVMSREVLRKVTFIKLVVTDDKAYAVAK
ncbi:zinc-binding metallopeptidase family protein [Bradyrhizobium sp. McL0615]|uniref:zinc-binding metallopeptidase family protein n=1 Tax=Bradyrhizobium sp. McL0615 TaxID=3415673 RepID=UPI003CF4D257